MKAFVYAMNGQVGPAVDEDEIVLFFAVQYVVMPTDGTFDTIDVVEDEVVVVEYADTADSVRSKIQSSIRSSQGSPSLPVVFVLDSKGLL